MADNTTISHKDFKARVMQAERLSGDQIFGLPPGTPLAVYHSECFVDWPENWMKGPEVFLVPVPVNKGLWFDWTMNDELNTAVLPTVKGCNPITGLATSGFHLERYEEKCPKHGIAFEAERYCPKCNYKWPPQNYVSYKNTLWWDGFASVKDGTVRQFFFSEDPTRDIPDRLIGKQNTVPAFGFAFYRPKELRKAKETSIFNTYSYPGTDTFRHYVGWPPDGTAGNIVYKCKYMNSGSYSVSCSVNEMSRLTLSNSCGPSGSVFRSVNPKSRTSAFSWEMENKEKAKEVSIGAGAKIRQALTSDPYPLDSWKDSPDCSVVIYFVFHQKFEELKANGFKNLEGSEEGILAGMPVG